ncbi:hypothetical protein JM946_27975 [Steroidobacter sp. S1-65]|uniref:Uncharacterized protein n=1 Tax=Steroidobacter gossypii TaxID=2805490 RepID=A0ABS1X5U4_9GAMM|nr:hypothetical protein [Steroidobacter gossypii]
MLYSVWIEGCRKSVGSGDGRPDWHIECSAMSPDVLARRPMRRLRPRVCTTASSTWMTTNCRSPSATSFVFAMY